MPDSPSTSSSRTPKNAATPTERFRLKPRYRSFAFAAIGLGLAMLACWLVFGLDGASRTFALTFGALGVVLGGLFLLSPTWRLVVVVDDQGIEVTSPSVRRFRVAWNDVARVIASPSTHTCFVDGGAPELSFLVPGDGAPAPYSIENSHALYRAIVNRTPADRLVETERLDRFRADEVAAELASAAEGQQ